MGLRISIGAIIAVLLGGTGYFAQQSQTTKDLLQQREAELKTEKESSAKLKSEIQGLKDIDQKMKSLESQLAKEVASAKTQMEELDKRVTEKSAAIEQDQAKIQSLGATLQENQTALDNERKARAEVEKSNQQNVELAAGRAEEIVRLEAALKENQTTLASERKARSEELKRLEAQAKESSRLAAEKDEGIKQQKAEIRNLKAVADIIEASLNYQSRLRAKAEKANKANIELAANRAEEIKNIEAALKENQTTLASERKARSEEIKRLEAQAKVTSRLIAEKNTAIEQEKEKARKFEIALKRIQANLKSDRKTQALVDKLSKQTLEFAAERAKEIKRLESVRGILEAQVLRMDRLIASEQKEAKKNDITAIPKTAATTEKVKALNGELARKRTEEIARLEKTRALLKTQVQEMGRLIAEKNAGIAREKTKAQNLELALNQIRTSLDNERKTRAKTEKANARNAELARIRAEEIGRLTKARELQKAQIQEMSQLIGEKTSVAELIKNKLDQTNLSLAETIKKHTLAIARSKVLEKRALEEAERAKRLESDLSEMSSKLKEQLVSLQETKDLLRVTFVNSLLFDSGSATLKEQGREALSTVADFLQKQKDKMIRIEGHTDNRPIKGNLLDRYPSNWELSFARSISIVKFLESKNISPARMSATGHSFYRPVASNETDEGRARNRRTVILLSSLRPKVEGAAR